LQGACLGWVRLFLEKLHRRFEFVLDIQLPGHLMAPPEAAIDCARSATARCPMPFAQSLALTFLVAAAGWPCGVRQNGDRDARLADQVPRSRDLLVEFRSSTRLSPFPSARNTDRRPNLSCANAFAIRRKARCAASIAAFFRPKIARAVIFQQPAANDGMTRPRRDG